MNLNDIYSRLKKDIQYIERELERAVHSDFGPLHDASIHLLKAGGKRIRPVFVLLSGEFGGYPLDRLKNIAVALESIHMASLVHDDVIDNADTRRGQKTVKAKWDQRVAMYTGDYIFAKALIVAGQIANPRVHQVLSKAIIEMTIGEMEQIRDFFNTQQSVRRYLLRIRRKTALLIAISCQLGAMVTDVPASTVRSLYAFGYNAGLAFQIRDDILDLCGTEKEIGKPPGSDVRQGNITLPVIYALQDSRLRPDLLKELALVEQGDASRANRVIELVRGSGGVEQADELANRYIDKAIEAVQQLPNIQAKNNLVQIAHFIANRSY